MMNAAPAGSRLNHLIRFVEATNRLSSAPGRNRTYDLALRRRTLYPLSYGRDARDRSIPRLQGAAAPPFTVSKQITLERSQVRRECLPAAP